MTEPKTGGEGSALPAIKTESLDWQSNTLLLAAKFPHEFETNPDALKEFVQVASAIGLNPFLGEVVPIHGRPYVTEEGWLRLIDERAPGQLVGDVTSIASEDEAKQFGVKGGWLGKAVVTRRILGLDGKPADRVVTDYAFLSVASVQESVIDAVRAEPFRQAMKMAHVRALRKAFRDVLARSTKDYVVSAAGGDVDEPIVIDAKAVRVLIGNDYESTEDTERRRFWARCHEFGIAKISTELMSLLDLPEPGASLNNHWIGTGHTWMEANQRLDNRFDLGTETEVCSICHSVEMEAYTAEGNPVCTPCGEKWEKEHDGSESEPKPKRASRSKSK